MAGIAHLDPLVFRTDDPRELAASLKRSADRAAPGPRRLRTALLLLAYALQRKGLAGRKGGEQQAIALRHELFRLYGRALQGRRTRPRLPVALPSPSLPPRPGAGSPATSRAAGSA